MTNPFLKDETLAKLPTDERIKALERIIPRTHIDEVLAQTGHDQAFCKRLPGWFMVWFVAGLGLFCTDCYRQIFRWLQSFRPGSIPGRSTLCEARKRLGCWPLLALLRRVVCLLGKPETPGAFYRGMRTMAVDGFVLDQMLADGSFRSKMYRCDSDRRHDRNAIMTRSSLGKNSS